ncbi:MAG: hypothetical protein COC12_08410 [Rhodobacteraceae bacterium]|nr:MAG: hypothetical protein COC12_08410 [Paracoccaceae bacterium]
MAWNWYRPGQEKKTGFDYATKAHAIRAAVGAGLKDGQSAKGRKAAQGRFNRMTEDEVATFWRCLVSAGWHVRRDGL